MGILLDATVLIDVERRLRRQPAADAMGSVAWHVARLLGPDEQLSIAAVTASELLHGVHRADAAHRPRREAFVEAALDFLPTIPFDLRTARIHSQLWVQLSATGLDITAHDRMIAATALAHGWPVVTANVRHFRQVPGLDVTELRLD